MLAVLVNLVPVHTTLLVAFGSNDGTEHDDETNIVVPDHLPEVCKRRIRPDTLSGDPHWLVLGCTELGHCRTYHNSSRLLVVAGVDLDGGGRLYCISLLRRLALICVLASQSGGGRLEARGAAGDVGRVSLLELRFYQRVNLACVEVGV